MMLARKDPAISENRPGLTVAEIAAKYGYAEGYVRRYWLAMDGWPTAIGKRGRSKEFDHDAVDEFYQKHFARRTSGETSGSPDDLLTVAEIAAYTGRARSTVAAYISRGQFPGSDKTDEKGVKLWRRSTVDRDNASRRRPTVKKHQQ